MEAWVLGNYLKLECFYSEEDDGVGDRVRYLGIIFVIYNLFVLTLLRRIVEVRVLRII